MTNQLLTETLPTVVGASVVYKTTETAFGMRGRKKTTRRGTEMTKRKRKRVSAKRSEAAKKGWRTRRRRYGKDGRKG